MELAVNGSWSFFILIVTAKSSRNKPIASWYQCQRHTNCWFCGMHPTQNAADRLDWEITSPVYDYKAANWRANNDKKKEIMRNLGGISIWIRLNAFVQFCLLMWLFNVVFFVITFYVIGNAPFCLWIWRSQHTKWNGRKYIDPIQIGGIESDRNGIVCIRIDCVHKNDYHSDEWCDQDANPIISEKNRDQCFRFILLIFFFKYRSIGA